MKKQDLEMPIMELPFMGQTMTCVMCDKVEKSNPNKESNWRAIDIGGSRYYACPNEFPPDGSSVDDFETAYLKIFIKIMNLIERRSNHARKQ